eukprot:CAMPEP_0113671600 /NCGR_PEP_ID=MMETSP0038_2-20120614/5792_1 /TAXON_ID=2898 /ORGANISM="Cryptomonas paramecium" /LENGTH=197 /DNA_ID=CAMNT_0000587765 /DNA_START=312 /DNA_END=905 /DNA_ORIENTATION=- /assembly_acc=CAM_ASM_000170
MMRDDRHIAFAVGNSVELAVLVIGSYLIIRENFSVNELCNVFASVSHCFSPFVFMQPGQTESDQFDVSDCWNAIEHVLYLKWIDSDVLPPTNQAPSNQSEALVHVIAPFEFVVFSQTVQDSQHPRYSESIANSVAELSATLQGGEPALVLYHGDLDKDFASALQAAGFETERLPAAAASHRWHHHVISFSPPSNASL